ncbi:hypothetical protein X965_11240 [Morganella sp. EGD-HP17]|nr:hypothetical protein X965_11240 [Morganella sp. EGD-HP17]
MHDRYINSGYVTQVCFMPLRKNNHVTRRDYVKNPVMARIMRAMLKTNRSGTGGKQSAGAGTNPLAT